MQVGLDALVVASVYVPNGGKDYAAKIRFLQELERYAAEVHARGQSLILCGDVNVARDERDVHPQAQRHRSAPGRARSLRQRSWTGLGGPAADSHP